MDPHQDFEPVPPPRFKPVYIEGREWIFSRPTKAWFFIVFLCLWLTGWTFGGFSAFAQILRGEGGLFLLVWICGWGIGWLAVVGTLLWQFAGKMMVGTDGIALVYRWSIPIISRSRRFDVHQVRDLRAAPANLSLYGASQTASFPPFWPGSRGSVQFDYGGRTIEIMPGLDEAEGKAIVALLNRQLHR